jgi:hypothetical protein
MDSFAVTSERQLRQAEYRRRCQEEQEQYDVVMGRIEALVDEHRELLARHRWSADKLVEDLKDRTRSPYGVSHSVLAEEGRVTHQMIGESAARAEQAAHDAARLRTTHVIGNWGFGYKKVSMSLDQLTADIAQLRTLCADLFPVVSCQTPCRHCGHTIIGRGLRDVTLYRREWTHLRTDSEGCPAPDWQPEMPRGMGAGTLAEPTDGWWRAPLQDDDRDESSVNEVTA